MTLADESVFFAVLEAGLEAGKDAADFSSAAGSSWLLAALAGDSGTAISGATELTFSVVEDTA